MQQLLYQTNKKKEGRKTKIIAINGSPRKQHDTATLLEAALDGASSQGAETKIINLYDLNYKGCISCFACKLKGGKNYRKCGYLDELSPVLKKIMEVDALLLASPIYFGFITGEMRSFLERLMFPVLTYTESYKGLLERKIPVEVIYNMGAPKEHMIEMKYPETLQLNEYYLNHLYSLTYLVKTINCIIRR